jgi:flagellar hook-basal body complex protein FliE
MSVDALAAIAPVELGAAQLAPAPAGVQGAGFGDWFTREVGAVNAALVNADQGIRQLAAGESHSLHQVMIDLEAAKLSFQLLAQVRNRMLEAYQEVMRMPV